MKRCPTAPEHTVGPRPHRPASVCCLSACLCLSVRFSFAHGLPCALFASPCYCIQVDTCIKTVYHHIILPPQSPHGGSEGQLHGLRVSVARAQRVSCTGSEGQLHDRALKRHVSVQTRARLDTNPQGETPPHKATGRRHQTLSPPAPHARTHACPLAPILCHRSGQCTT